MMNGRENRRENARTPRRNPNNWKTIYNRKGHQKELDPVLVYVILQQLVNWCNTIGSLVYWCKVYWFTGVLV